MQITKERLLLDLYIAFYDARKGKSRRKYVIEFEEHLHENLVALRDAIYYRKYEQCPLVCFIITHPKKREVFASKFIDRIVHHLYFNYTHALFENTFIYDCYSCIKGRGTSFGIDRLKYHIRSESRNYAKKCWVLKLDISSYFMSINRKKLLDIVLKRLDTEPFKQSTDTELLKYLSVKIISKDPTNGCIMRSKPSDYAGMAKGKSLFNAPNGNGLPIGNLTSQLYSNVYLNLLDQFIKRKLKMKHYGRYVDDLFIVSKDKEKLLECVSKIRAFLKEELHLSLNEGKTIINEVKRGVEFLGAYIKPWRTYISNQCLRRIKTKLTIDIKMKTKEQLRQSFVSRLGFLKQFNSYNIARRIFYYNLAT